MSLIHEAVDGVVPDCPGCTRSPTGMASPDARLIQQLHDGPAQWLALALLKMDRALGADCVADAGLLHNVRMLLDEALHGIRYVLDDWGDGETVEPMSLTAALTDLGRRLVSLTGLTLCLECDDRVTDPPASVTAVVLHAVQELLLNTCKYAPGAKAEVLLAAEADGFELTIRDDGPGFDPVDVYRHHSIVGGLGLGAMPERLASVGGFFSVYSRPGEGVRACIRWPDDFAEWGGLARCLTRIRSSVDVR